MRGMPQKERDLAKSVMVRTVQRSANSGFDLCAALEPLHPTGTTFSSSSSPCRLLGQNLVVKGRKQMQPAAVAASLGYKPAKRQFGRGEFVYSLGQFVLWLAFLDFWNLLVFGRKALWAHGRLPQLLQAALRGTLQNAPSMNGISVCRGQHLLRTFLLPADNKRCSFQAFYSSWTFNPNLLNRRFLVEKTQIPGGEIPQKPRLVVASCISRVSATIQQVIKLNSEAQKRKRGHPPGL